MVEASTASERDRARGKSAARIVLGVLIVGLPLLMLFGLPTLLMSSPYVLDNYLPFLSDDVYYWRQAAAFSTVGLDSGYFTIEEATARAGNYYAWGIFIPALQGTIAHLFGGIAPLSIPLMGAVLLGIALALLLLALKPGIEQELWLLGGLAVFAPLWILHLNSMSEMIHLTSAVLIATVFYKLMTAPTRRWALAGVIIVIAATLLRPTMSLFFVPLCLLLVRPLSPMKVAFAVGLALALAALPVYTVLQTTAPYPFQNWLPILDALPQSPIQAVRLALLNARANLGFWSLGVPAEKFQRVQSVGLVVLLLVVGRLDLRWRGLHIPRLARSEILLHLYNLSVIIGFYVLLYDVRDMRDFRGVAPHLLFSLVLFAAFRRRFWLALFVISGALFLPQARVQYTDWARSYLLPGRPAQLAEWKGKLANVLEYEPNAPSPWCNTVLHNIYYLNDVIPVLALPPEFGTSFIFGMTNFHDPPWSRYVMLDDEDYARYPERFASLKRMIDLPGGALYFNPNSKCVPVQPPVQSP